MPKLAKYLLFTFAASWLLMAIGVRDYENAGTAGIMTFSYSLSAYMLMPTIGALIAGADFRKLGWKPVFGKGARYLLIAWLAPTVFAVLGAVVYYTAFPNDFATAGNFVRDIDRDKYIQCQESGGSYTWYVIRELFSSFTSFFIIPSAVLGLGEEIGWRGFMFPELRERFGRTKGVILGGAIHGAWHFPLMLLAGYEYGRDYIGAPHLGLFAFTIFCITTGTISNWLYEKTRCIWLCGLFHGAVNSSFDPCILRADGHYERSVFGPMDIGLVAGIPYMIASFVVLYMQHKHDEADFAGLGEMDS